MKFLYLALDLITISYPLLRSFEHRIHYVSKWKSLFPAIIVVGAFFIIWDVLFTRHGIWGFNDTYITGFRIINLPIEEWLFFVSVPFSCMFIYEVMNYFVKKDILGKAAPYIALVIATVLAIAGSLHLEKLYTSITFLLTAALLYVHVFVIRAPYLGRFFLSYAVCLIPFFMANGILTGSFIPDQVVWYNNDMNLSIRMGTIPLEDSMYLLLLLLGITTIYEHLESRKRA